MTVLRNLTDTEFDFPLNFYTRKVMKQTYNKMFTRNMIIIFFAKFGEVSGACNFFFTV